MPPHGNGPEAKTHPRLLECDSRQIVQTQTTDSDKMVPISAGVQSLVLQIGPNTARLFATWYNHKLPRFVSPVPDQKAWAIDVLSLPWEDLDV